MQLQQFQVKGYKNFRVALRLEEMGRFNVVHGDNNVGKSNLLESIGLFFLAIQALRDEGRGGPSLDELYLRRTPLPAASSDGRPPRAVTRSFDYFTRLGYAPGEIFALADPQAIVLEARVLLDRREGEAAWLDAPVAVALRIERGDEEVRVALTELRRTADGVDLLVGEGEASAVDASYSLVLERLGQRLRGKENVPRFVLVRADRSLAHEAMEGGAPLATREPLPRSLGKILHDAEGATDARRARFQRFVTALDRFADLVGPGRWRMRFDTSEDRAELVLDTGAELLPLRLMGSGIQQLVALCARLFMTGADLVAIEEPELNLRWSVQRALRDVLHGAVGHAEGPAQLILTSHSGQFEEEPSCYVLTRTAEGPRVQKKSASEGWAYTQPEAPPLPTGTRAPLGYLTTEGVVEVPREVQKDLGLTHGGGVVFVKGKDGHYRVLTNDQYADLFEEREPAS